MREVLSEIRQAIKGVAGNGSHGPALTRHRQSKSFCPDPTKMTDPPRRRRRRTFELVEPQTVLERHRNPVLYGSKTRHHGGGPEGLNAFINAPSLQNNM
jgi:hypothetical protein